MPACRGDLQRALGLCLPFYFAHVRIVRREGLRLADMGRDSFASGEVRRHLQQRLRRIHGCVFHQSGFGGVRLRENKSASVVNRPIGHRQRAANGSQFACQRQFTGIFVFFQFLVRDLPGGSEYAERDRQIEAPAFLGQIGGRQIDGDAARRKVKSAVLQRGAHAVFAFFYFGFRKTHDGEVGQAVGDMHLDCDESRFHPGKRAAVQNCEAHKYPSKLKVSSPYCVALKKSCLHILAYAALRFLSRALSGLEI